ncbi:MAG: hypothetical protein K2Z80_13310 [Xanthobacteraceae bacterium]|nr:hypothetical protein [Xanthobacteraceae bacterium]
MDLEKSFQWLLSYLPTLVVVISLAGLGHWARKASERAKARRDGVRIDVDYGEMEQVIREWVAFMAKSPPQPQEIRDTRELPRKKSEIALALYLCREQGKSQELKDGALVYLDTLAQYQDGVGDPIAPPHHDGRMAERWKEFHAKVLQDRAVMRRSLETSPR